MIAENRQAEYETSIGIPIGILSENKFQIQ